MTKFKSVESLGHDKRPTIGFLSILLSAISLVMFIHFEKQKKRCDDDDDEVQVKGIR